MSSTAWAHDDSAFYSCGFVEDVIRWEPSYVPEEKAEKDRKE